MRQCVYPGCTNRRSPATLKRKSFHRLPGAAELQRRQLWLIAIRKDINLPDDETKDWTVCSDHFDEDDFFVKEAERDTAPTKKGYGLRKSKKKTFQRFTRTHIHKDAVPRVAALQEMPTASSSGSSNVVTETAVGESSMGAEALPDFTAGDTSSSTVQTPEKPQSCRQKRNPSFYLSTPPQAVQTPRTTPSLSGIYEARPPTFFLKPSTTSPSALNESTTSMIGTAPTPVESTTEPTMTQLNTSFTSLLSVDVDSMESASGQSQEDTDSSFRPSSHSPSSESLDESDMPDEDKNGVNWVPKRRWIVDEDKLLELFQFCPHCGEAITKKEPHLMGGSRLVIKWECHGGCHASWENSPQLAHRAADNNILISASIFFTGATYTDISEWAELINLQIPKQTQFYSIQKNYLIPVIKAAYEKKNKEIIERLKLENTEGQRTELCGDGRSDSPGFSAKYTTYSFQDDKTKEVVHFELVQVSEAPSSVAMELIGFERGLERIQYLGVDIGVIATDRSPSIRKLMHSAKYEGVIQHEFDPWHVAKNVTKKLLAVGIKAANRPLQPWIKFIRNHLYWSSEHSGGDPEVCVRLWRSLVHHICGIHRWEEDGVQYECRHQKYSEEEQRKKKWLTADSPAFRAVQSVVLDPNLLRDLRQMALFKHTGSLEVFHSMMLKYTPKRLHFFYDSFLARTQLAVMDHNYNVGRPEATTKTGTEKVKIQVSKISKEYVLKGVKVKTQQLPFRKELLDLVMELRVEKALKKKTDKKRAPFPRPNIAKTDRPDVSVLMARRSDRFSHQLKK